ncbi:MAG TPA: hypothetical protein VIO60_07670 [Rectinemataceae bacterium]
MRYSGAPRASGAPRTALVLAIFAALASNLPAQALEAWLAAHAAQASYLSIADKARSLGASLAKAGLSDSLIADRLAEAFRKRVPAATLGPILEEDARRYLALASSMRGMGLLPAEPKKASEAVEQASILLRAGIPESALAAALSRSASRLGPGMAAMDRALAALSVVATIQAEYRLSEPELLALATGLVDSDLATGKLNSFATSVKSAIKKGLSVTQAIEDSLAKASKTKTKAGQAEGSQAESDKAEGGKAENGAQGEKGKEDKPGKR